MKIFGVDVVAASEPSLLKARAAEPPAPWEATVVGTKDQM